MKNTMRFLLLFTMLGAFASCETFLNDELDDNSGIEIPVSQLPQAVIDYVNTNFPGMSIIRVERDSDHFEVYLPGDIELYFDLNGNFLRDDNDDDDDGDDDDSYLPISALPQSALAYIANQYGDVGILKIKLDDGEYEVYLANGYKLHFDINGDFKKSERENEGENHIPINNLPQAIANYLLTNYPNNPVVKAEIEDNKYEIYLQGGYKLYFDLNGNFLRIER